MLLMPPMLPQRQFRLPFRQTRELWRDIDDELSHHHEMAAAGDAAETRPRAYERLRRKLFWIDFLADKETRIMMTLRDLVADLSFAIRLTRRRPSSAVLVVLTLAIGIGTATTLAHAIDTILLQPLPLSTPERVMTLWRVSEDGGDLDEVAPGTVADWRERSTSFDHVAGAEPYSMSYDDGSGPRSIGTWRVTKGFFDTLRTRPTGGRLLEARDYEDGADPVVVVSHAFWTTRLGADRGVLEDTLTLSGTPRRVVGVLPPNFPYAEGRQFYVPRLLTGSWRENRNANFYLTYGLLANGVTAAKAESELREIARATAIEFPASDEGLSATVVPMADALVASVRPALLLLFLAALLILVIASVNAASLMLTEASRRAHELAIRAALGAGRSRMVRQVFTESVFLAGLAGVLGVLVAVGGLAGFRAYSPPGMPRINELTVDPGLIAFGGLFAALIAALVGLSSAMRVASADLHDALRPGGRGGLQSPGASRLRKGLVGVQVALAVVLLASCGLLLRSWVALAATDQGYVAEGLGGAEAHFWHLARTPDARLSFARNMVSELELTPGVEATVTSSLPVSQAIGNEQAEVQLPEAAAAVASMALSVGESFFDVLGIDVLQGRGIDDTILPDGESVAVINESLRDRLWPGGSGLGELVAVSYGGPPQARRVIGVVADVRYRSLERETGPTVYLPHTQAATGSLYFVVRHAAGSGEALTTLRQTIRRVTPTLALDEIVAIEEQARVAGKARRFSLLLLAAFGAISVLLTGIGLFGLMAQTVRSRTQELGVRMALGAWPKRLRTFVFGHTARLVTAGAFAGAALFVVLSQFLRGMLYGVPVLDPLTLLGVALAIAAVGALAAWIPARMATRVDPATALRVE